MELEIGKWYSVSPGTLRVDRNAYYIKYSGLQDDRIRCSEYIYEKRFKNIGGGFGKPGDYTFTKINTEEIKKYLPPGHHDLLIPNTYELWN